MDEVDQDASAASRGLMDSDLNVGAGSLAPAPLAPTPVAELPGVGIRVDGALVAWFADPEAAGEWATENHFGNWLAHPCTMPNRPPFTPAQIAEAEREGALLWAKLQPGRLAED